MKEYISHLRSYYEGELLDEKFVSSDPMDQFRSWFKEALGQR